MVQKYLNKINAKPEKMAKLSQLDLNVYGGETIYFHIFENGHRGWVSTAAASNNNSYFLTATSAILADKIYGGSGLTPAQEMEMVQNELLQKEVENAQREIGFGKNTNNSDDTLWGLLH